MRIGVEIKEGDGLSCNTCYLKQMGPLTPPPDVFFAPALFPLRFVSVLESFHLEIYYWHSHSHLLFAQIEGSMKIGDKGMGGGGER